MVKSLEQDVEIIVRDFFEHVGGVEKFKQAVFEGHFLKFLIGSINHSLDSLYSIVSKLNKDIPKEDIKEIFTSLCGKSVYYSGEGIRKISNCPTELDGEKISFIGVPNTTEHECDYKIYF